MHLHNVKLWKRDRGLLGSIELQGDGAAEVTGEGPSLVVSLVVSGSFPSAWDAVGYTYSLVGFHVDEKNTITEHTHPRLFYRDEELMGADRLVRLSAAEQS